MKLYNNIGKFAVAITCGLLLMGNVSAQSACGSNTSLNNPSGTTCRDYVNTSGTGVMVENAGSIVDTVSPYSAILVNGGSISDITNSSTGTIGNTGGATYGINQTAGEIDSIVNSGTITGSDAIHINAIVDAISNASTGVISGTSGGYGIWEGASGVIGVITNSGVISGPGEGMYVQGQISTINNSGTISGVASGANGIYSGNWGGVYGTIGAIINTGTIIGSGTYGIYNVGGSITTLSNAQGIGNAHGALSYEGTLPTNYNIIINSPTNYGQLAVTSGTGNTTFGISALSGVGVGILGAYSHVLSGIANTQLGLGSGATSITGTSNGYGYTLTETASGSDIWNLTVLSAPITTPSGPSTANTQQSLASTASALQSVYTLQNSVLANSFSYDCTEFGANGVCISAGGRNTAVSAANGLNNTSALLIAAYRALPSVRIGAYADQNLSVNNGSSTVILGNNTPLVGLFGAWNENQDGTGTEVKVSAAYGQKNTTINRSVVGTGSAASEAGSGSSQLNSQGAQVTAKYGFGILPEVIVSPYVGMRYTQNNMGGYTESASATVTAPLTYSALNTNATTALAGIGASYKGIPKATLFASAGVETDTNTANGSYFGNNAYFSGGLTPVNFNANPVKTRPTATLGAYYDVEKNQRVGLTGIYRQEPFQAVSTTAVMATYTVGL